MISIQFSPLITNLSLHSFGIFSIQAQKKQGQAGNAWVYCSEGNKGPLLSRTAYLSYHRVVVYLEIVLRRSLLYKDLQRNITSIFKKEKKLPLLVHPALV